MTIERICLLGSSSGRNAGDAALLSGIMDTIDQAVKSPRVYEIPSIRPAYVQNTYPNKVEAINILPWTGSLKLLGLPTYQSMMRSDLSLVFDAVLFDRSLYNPFFNFLSSLHFLSHKVKKHGKKLGFFNVTAGPVYTKKGQEMLRELSDIMDFITVRDQDSLDVLRSIGVTNKNILVTADAAVNAPGCDQTRSREILAQIGLDTNQEILAININSYLDTWARAEGGRLSQEEFLSIYSNALNHFLSEHQQPVLFVSTQHGDEKITRALMERVNASNKALLSNKTYSHIEIKGVLQECSLLVGMRLHAMILGSSNLTPIVGLSYLPKCTHYFKTLGIPEYILEFDQFSEKNLYNLISDGWTNRKELKSQLVNKMPTLKAKAFQAAHLVAAIHKGQNLSAVLQCFEHAPPSKTMHSQLEEHPSQQANTLG